MDRRQKHILSLLITTAGGYMDAYSYLSRGGVFATGQTGNFVLLAVNAAQLNFSMVLQCSIAASEPWREKMHMPASSAPEICVPARSSCILGLVEKDASAMARGLRYLEILGAFFSGVLLGVLTDSLLKAHSAWGIAFLLVLAGKILMKYRQNQAA